MSEQLLELQEISSGYGRQMILNDIGFGVREGSLTAIIGPNGHGKTTLLRTISGLVKARQGAIRLGEREVSRLPVHAIVAAGVVHIPQGDMIFPEMTVRDNLLMGAYLPEANRHADDRLAGVYEMLPRLQERQSQIASSLSGGERRMLGIGRGLMTGGRILLIDEPSLGLAPIVIEQIYEVIADLKRRGHTILLVEENPTRAMSVADEIHLLDNGRFVWSGGPDELEANPGILETYLGG